MPHNLSVMEEEGGRGGGRGGRRGGDISSHHYPEGMSDCLSDDKTDRQAHTHTDQVL